MTGYLRNPTIHGDDVVFVTDDDLWHVGAGGGRAYRLTSGAGESSGPRFTPDGQHIVFIGREEGAPDIYVMPAVGGSARRVTFAGGAMLVAGFDPDGRLIYATDTNRPFYGDRWLHRVGLDGGAPEILPIGPATVIEHGPGDGVVVGRVVRDPARWKRYRGGQVGDLWIDRDGSGEFRRLVKVDGNLASPAVIGDRVYFISDHEGTGNVYSCTPDGTELRRHSHHEDFYARGLSGDGHRLIYHAGGDLWLLDPAAGEPQRLDISTPGTTTQRSRQFVPAENHLDTVNIAPGGAHLALCVRGKAYTMGHFAGPVHQHGEPDGVRYRLLRHLHGAATPAVEASSPVDISSKRLIAAASDETDRERLVLLDGTGSTFLSDVDTGRISDLTASPAEDLVAVANHRNELMLVDLRSDEATARVVDSSRFGRIEDLAWSPDGAWLAYTYPESGTTSAIKLLRISDGTTHRATRPVLRDRRPAFDPLGRYLYFIGQREFDPVYDELQFEMSFPLGSRPFVVTLRATEPAPFLGEITAPSAKPGAPKDAPTPEGAPPVTVEIDLDGIERRVVALPVPDGRYERVAGTRDKVLYTSHPVIGERSRDALAPEGSNRTLHACTLSTGKCDKLADGIVDFSLSPDHATLLYRADDRLRVLAAGEKPSDGTDAGPETGWIDLGRVKVSVRPDAEWRQMFREAWRLQRENFWDVGMSAIDWNEVYDRYLPLVDRIATRSELSDLLWELHGELGTSHAYESGGAYRQSPHYEQGFLGVDWAVEGDAHRIARVLDGDVWSEKASSPLARPGLDVRAGDEIVAINGITVQRDRSPGALLVNQAGQEVEVTVRRGEDPVRTLRVRPLADEHPLRYREWVNANRALVHERSEGRVGYLHIPDMIASGFAEFHRGLLTEYDYEALLVDVRYNRGGHVSGLLLQKLARRRLGYDFSRWGDPQPYPSESPRGAMVMLTNEHAGSDGDIVSHAFKQLGLGPLIGHRTWGGVVGIWPRHPLADGTTTTQPEFAFAFDNVGWGVENYGTDPDIEVDNAPHDYARGVDAQLERGIVEALAELERKPAHSPTAPPLPRQVRARLSPIVNSETEAATRTA